MEATETSLAGPKDPPPESDPPSASSLEPPPRDFRFWLILLSLSLSSFIAALELTALSTALPVIVAALHGSQFVWVGSAYSLASTAFIPMSGGLAQVFGRRLVMLGSLLIFAVASAACGAATNMNALIVARAFQGLGGGGILSLTGIILSDLVSLRDRGKFNAIIGIAWVSASGMGPVVGGALAEGGNWRWLFYLNIPIAGVAAALILFFLRVRTPTCTFKEKMAQMDWIGNILIISSSSACMISLVWGGVQYPWSSVQVLVPLILGIVGIASFIVYEAKVAKYPVVPFALLSTRTSVSGYLQTFFSQVILLAFVYDMPVYFQACKLASPIASGVDALGIACTIAPTGIVSGVSVAKFRRYRPQLWLSWVLTIIAGALLSTITAGSSLSKAIGYESVFGLALGIHGTTTYFPVLAPTPVSENAKALAFFTFSRSFAQVWGVTIGGSVLQNELKHRLPSSFVSKFPGGTNIAYAAIPLIPTLAQPLKGEVQIAFAGALSVTWKVLIGIGVMGLISSLPMKGLPLHTETDKDWGIVESEGRERKV